mmetsp:Transcript_10718/g.15967  ORF Transcript_10718/g.15967 Transcript_10718/m.15967 type:complete len:205 (-) Transcript_10718:67-681(-)
MSINDLMNVADKEKPGEMKAQEDARANINEDSKLGRSPLHKASVHGHIDVVRCLIEKKANVQAKYNQSCHPLNLASYLGHFEVVRYLIEKKTNVYAIGDYGEPHWATWTQRYCQSEPTNNCNARDNKGWTPMMYAAREGHFDIVKFLVSKKADFLAKNNDGMTALDIAKKHKRQKIVNYLKRAKKKFLKKKLKSAIESKPSSRK